MGIRKLRKVFFLLLLLIFDRLEIVQQRECWLWLLEPSVASGQKRISRSEKPVMQREGNRDETWKWKRVVLPSLRRPLGDLPASQQRGRSKGEQPFYSTRLYGGMWKLPFWTRRRQGLQFILMLANDKSSSVHTPRVYKVWSEFITTSSLGLNKVWTICTILLLWKETQVRYCIT